MITDVGFQPRDDSPWWNESSFITLRLPDLELMGILYYYFRPNQSTAMGGPIFFDHSGDEVSTCLHNGWDWNMPLPDGADMFDFTLANGFSSRTLAPQQQFELTYEHPACSFELTFAADVPPMELTERDAGLSHYFAPGTGPTPSGHYDQIGAVSGTIRLDGRELVVDAAPALRDRSWGPRRLLSNVPDKPRGSYLFARASAGAAFQATVLSDLPTDDDPVVGVADQVRSGLYTKDGVTGALISGTRRVTDRGPDGRPAREVLEATDEHGRVLHAVGTIGSVLRWPGIYGDIMAFWCYEKWAFDGHDAAPGENQEFFTSRGFRRFRAQHH